MTVPQYPQSFAAAWQFARATRGWLGQDEAELLYELARTGCNFGKVVELGAYCGRSSIVLAAAIAAVANVRVACVDTFCGSAEHQPGAEYFDPLTLVDGKVNTLPQFMANLERAGLADRVDVTVCTSVEAASRIDQGVSLLFIDADHEYAAIRADIAAWIHKLTPVGWIVIHDVGAWSGATRAAADLLDSGYRRYAQAGTALALRKETK
jgi:predicted O-methyltransferase YrrM